MVAAGCAAVAVFLLLRPTRRPRCDRILATVPVRHRANPPPATIAMVLVAVACLVVVGMPFGPAVAAVAVPVTGRTVARLEPNASRRRRLLVARQLPGAVDLLIGVLAAGRPPDDAFAVVGRAVRGPLGEEFVLIASRLAIAGDEQAVWASLRARPDLAAVGRSFGRASRSGMPVGDILARLAEDLRRERSAVATQRARGVAVATAAPLGLCFLPAFFLIAIVPSLIGAFTSFQW